jgi:hypothetical protein
VDLRVRPDEAGLVGDDDELGAVTGIQFGHGALDVGAYGQRADDEFPGDLVVGLALGGQGHHLTFAGREEGEIPGGRQLGAGSGAV